jgi:hypothetical protein
LTCVRQASLFTYNDLQAAFVQAKSRIATFKARRKDHQERTKR